MNELDKALLERLCAGFELPRIHNKVTDNSDGGPGSGNHNHQGRPGHIGGSAPGNGSRTVVQGKDISRTYTGKGDIKSVLKAQGFDGLPKVVTKDEFNEAIKASNFVAQRTYSASSQEILDAYRDQLYNGEWYVECTTGGAQYGQGMYCAADYNGELTDGIKAEMENYKSLYYDKMDRKEAISVAKQKIEDGIRQEAKNNLLDRFHPYVDGYDFQQGKWKPEFMDEARELKESNPELYGKVLNQLKGYEEKYDASAGSVNKLSTDEIGAIYGFPTRTEQISYTETMTIDPSANIVKYNDLNESFSGFMTSEHRRQIENDFANARFSEVGAKYGSDAETFARWSYGNSDISWKEVSAAAEAIGDEMCSILSKYCNEIRSAAIREADNQSRKIAQKAKEIQTKFGDIGSYAAALGYDAINAEGHGQSGSYTVILNRTKVIFLDESERNDSKDGSLITFQMGKDGVIYAIRDRKVIGWVSTCDYVPDNKERVDGGQGSGNYGHEGRPGEVGGSARGNASGESLKAHAPTQITKRRANEEIALHALQGDSDAVKAVLDKLPKGSKVKLPDHWNDNEKGDVLVKEDDDHWVCINSEYGYSAKTDEIVGYVINSGNDESERPMITSIAMTQDEISEALKRLEQSYWRNREQIWSKDESFDAQMTIKMRKLDLERCGPGFQVIGSDGRLYEKYEDGWYDSETFKKADMRRLKSPEFTGDFFDVNFGMNGLSKDECGKARAIYTNLPEELGPKYEQAFREARFTVAMRGSSHYSPNEDAIHFGSDADALTVFHECSHRMDHGLIDKTLDRGYYRYTINSASLNLDEFGNSTEQRNSDFEAMAKVIGYNTNGEGQFAGSHSLDSKGGFSARIDAYLKFSRQYRNSNGFPCVSDALSALTFDSCGESMFGGHEESYWARPYGGERASARSMEYWANYCVLRAMRDEESLALLESLTPNMYHAAEKTYEEAFKIE